MDQTQPIPIKCKFLDSGDLENDMSVQTYVVLHRKKQKKVQHIRGIGSVIFAIGVPMCIGGIVVSIVAYTDIMGTHEVAMFKVLGPGLLTISLILFIIGFVLAEVASKLMITANDYHPNFETTANRNSLYPELSSRSSSEQEFIPRPQNARNKKMEKRKEKKPKFSQKMMENSINSLDKAS